MYIVSACLAGVKCRYDGNDSRMDQIAEMVERGIALPLCPEMLGGLLSPRDCCEIITGEKGNERVITEEGADMTASFISGAEKTCRIAGIIGAHSAILKFRSPSCGYGMIYDGTFTGTKIEGKGIAAAMLEKSGIKIITENQIELIDEIISLETRG